MMNEISSIKKDVKDFLTKNQTRYEAFSKFQDSIDHLTEETYQDIIQFVQDHISILFKDHSNAIFFLSNVIRTAEYNFKKFELYMDIILHFSDSFKKLHLTEREMLIICIHFPDTINYLYSKNFFSIESIVEHSVNLINLFAFFYHEIVKYDSEYASIIEHILLHENNIGFNKNETDFLSYVKNHPEEHLVNRKLCYHPSKLHKSIRDDDIDTFQMILSKSNIGINYKIEYSPYERAMTIDSDCSLAQVAAVYGSLKIFKFLFMQNELIIDKNLLDYAYFGNNHEIIHLCEKRCSKQNAYIQSIRIHQTDLLDYFVENFYDEFKEKKNVRKQLIIFDENNKNDEDNEEEEDNSYNCLNYESLLSAVYSFNFPIEKRFLSKIVFITRKIEHVNDKDFNYNDSFLLNSEYDLDLFKFLYLQKNSIESSIKLNDEYYLYLLEELYFDATNDSFKFLFQELYKEVNLYFTLQTCIRCNHDIANYVLDLQFKENENDDQQKYIYNEIKRRIQLFDLRLAIKHYNEDIVIKMIKLYDLLNSKDNIKSFATALKDYTSSRMISSLYKFLCTFLSQDDLTYFASIFEFLKI